MIQFGIQILSIKGSPPIAAVVLSDNIVLKKVNMTTPHGRIISLLKVFFISFPFTIHLKVHYLMKTVVNSSGDSDLCDIKFHLKLLDVINCIEVFNVSRSN